MAEQALSEITDRIGLLLHYIIESKRNPFDVNQASQAGRACQASVQNAGRDGMRAAAGDVVDAERQGQDEGALTGTAIRCDGRGRVQPSCRTSAIHWIIPDVIPRSLYVSAPSPRPTAFRRRPVRFRHECRSRVA